MAILAVFERPYEAGDRRELHEYLKGLGVPVYHAAQGLFRQVPDVLFYHESDRGLLMSGADFDARLTTVWKICYGGFETSANGCDGQSLSYLSFRDLRSRIQSIEQALGPIAPSAITCELLQSLCFLFDPVLEDLLTPFATADPFTATDQEGKAALNAYIEEKLRNPGA